MAISRLMRSATEHQNPTPNTQSYLGVCPNKDKRGPMTGGEGLLGYNDGDAAEVSALAAGRKWKWCGGQRGSIVSAWQHPTPHRTSRPHCHICVPSVGDPLWRKVDHGPPFSGSLAWHFPGYIYADLATDTAGGGAPSQPRGHRGSRRFGGVAPGAAAISASSAGTRTARRGPPLEPTPHMYTVAGHAPDPKRIASGNAFHRV